MAGANLKIRKKREKINLDNLRRKGNLFLNAKLMLRLTMFLNNSLQL